MGDKSNWALEWERARDVIENCDEREHDLRKVGFTFLSSLLTAEALLWDKLAPNLQSRLGLPLLLVVLVMLLGMRLTEKRNELLKRAAALRARTLEVLSPIELSDSITDRHAIDGWPRYTTFVYLAFGAVGALISAVISSTGRSHAWLGVSIAALLIYGAVVVRVGRLELRMPRALDVSFNRVVCRSGETIAFAVINLGSHTQPVSHPVATIRRVLDAAGRTLTTAPVHPFELPETPGVKREALRPGQTFTWQWRAGDVGTYSVEVPHYSSEGLPSQASTRTLRKMIRVLPQRPDRAARCAELAAAIAAAATIALPAHPAGAPGAGGTGGTP